MKNQKKLDLINFIEKKYIKNNFLDLKIGDIVIINYLIPEGNKERIQKIEGIIIAKNHGGLNETFTLRRLVENIGLEQIFLLNSPKLINIETRQHSLVKRAKLYYLKNAKGKAARLLQKF